MFLLRNILIKQKLLPRKFSPSNFAVYGTYVAIYVAWVRYENVLQENWYVYPTEISLFAKAFCIGYSLTHDEVAGMPYT